MAVNPAKVILRQGKTALFICDVQEKFAKAIFQFDKIIQNSTKLVNSLNYIVLLYDLLECKGYVEVMLFLIIIKPVLSSRTTVYFIFFPFFLHVGEKREKKRHARHVQLKRTDLRVLVVN